MELVVCVCGWVESTAVHTFYPDWRVKCKYCVFPTGMCVPRSVFGVHWIKVWMNVYRCVDVVRKHADDDVQAISVPAYYSLDIPMGSHWDVVHPRAQIPYYLPTLSHSLLFFFGIFNLLLHYDIRSSTKMWEFSGPQLPRDCAGGYRLYEYNCVSDTNSPSMVLSVSNCTLKPSWSAHAWHNARTHASQASNIWIHT